MKDARFRVMLSSVGEMPRFAKEAVSKLGKRMDMRSEGPVVNRPGRQAGID
jgi:hypothetical protein